VTGSLSVTEDIIQTAWDGNWHVECVGKWEMHEEFELEKDQFWDLGQIKFSVVSETCCMLLQLYLLTVYTSINWWIYQQLFISRLLRDLSVLITRWYIIYK
jgi:hypothetical protein